MSIIKFPTKEEDQSIKDILENNLSHVDDIDDIIIISFLKNGEMETHLSNIQLKDVLWALKRLEHKILMYDAIGSS